jgi:hypothetical protein
MALVKRTSTDHYREKILKGVRDYKCGYCNWHTYCKSNIDQHQKTCKRARDAGFIPKPLYCSVIGCTRCPIDRDGLPTKPFKQQGNLDKHNKDHHGIIRSTRIKRNAMRKKYKTSRFISRKTTNSGTKIYEVFDTATDNIVSCSLNTKRIAEFDVDWLNIIDGLFLHCKTTFQDEFLSLCKDRPKDTKRGQICMSIYQCCMHFDHT